MPTLPEICALIRHEVDTSTIEVGVLENRLAVLYDLSGRASSEEVQPVVNLFDHLYVSVQGKCLVLAAKTALHVLDIEIKRFETAKGASVRPLWMDLARRTFARRGEFSPVLVRPMYIRAKSLAQYESYAKDGAILNALKDLHFRVERACTPASRQFLISNTGR